jgi:hypothetical protein
VAGVLFKDGREKNKRGGERRREGERTFFSTLDVVSVCVYFGPHVFTQ